MKTHLELRKAFKDFWEEKNHKEVPPISLVPKEDPTTLFTGFGMQQLVPYLLGEPHPLGKKLFNIQPCFRAQDIEEVGDNRHTTFFEMMGNWSLGTYFKEGQLSWLWDFYMNVIKLPKEKLYVTVFEGYKNIPADNESYEIWKKLGVPENHIFKYGPDKNWWSRNGVPDNMPHGEPGGPDSEVFYEFDSVKHNSKFGEKCHPNCDCGRFLEVSNSVFMQYKKEKDGTFSELPNKNVDFGGGIERLAVAVNDNPDIFMTDLYQPVIHAIEKVTGKSYSDSENHMRIVADHIKGAVFIIVEGVYPSNKEQGYILRRLLRRSLVKMKQLSRDFDFKPVYESVLDIYDGVQNINKKEQLKTVSEVINDEVNRFSQTLERGLREIQKIKEVNGKVAFDLYQSYGFPLEITEELLGEKGKRIEKQEFYKEFEKHKQISRQSAKGKFKGGLVDEGRQTIKYHTATHLIHQALFDVMGKVRQEGSNITSERLRFDFFSEKRPSQEDIKRVEEIVNQKIKESLPVRFEIMTKTKAEEIGALAFFKEKYGDRVKVYFVEDYSKEFCGGPHVKNTKEIGKVDIYKFEKIGSSLYRLYAK